MAREPDTGHRPETDNPPRDEGVLKNEYDGDAERDGIPANGTEPVAPRGPDDLGA